MKTILYCLLLMSFLLAGYVAVPAASPVERNAGNWPTWVVNDVTALSLEPAIAHKSGQYRSYSTPVMLRRNVTGGLQRIA